MPGLIEYRLDLQGTTPAYRYTGSGTLNVFGGAGTIVIDAYGIMNVWFEEKEWVYDLNHNQYQIVGMYNTPNAIVWAAYGFGQINYFSTEELLKFEQGPAFFTKKYKIIMEYYESILAQVNSKVNEYTQSGPITFSYSSTPITNDKIDKLSGILNNLQKLSKNIKGLNKNVRLYRTR